ncbi:MAG: sugar ABC transporter permease [Nitrososphaerota archaeon]
MRAVNPWLLFLPAFIVVGFNSFLPIVYAAYLSTQRFYLTGIEAKFIGYDNFTALMFDETVWRSLLTGAAFVVTCLVIEIPLGLVMALMMFKESKLNRVIRTLISYPILMPPITVGAVWLLLTRPDIGPIPNFLNQFGIVYDIGSNPFHAFFTVVAMDVWYWTPFVILVFVAARASISPEQYESAMVDGASSWHIFRYITFPGLRYALVVVLLIRMIDSLKIFDQVWILTSEGPYKATNFMSIYIVKTAIGQLNVGYGAALSLFFLFIIIILTFVMLKLVFGRRSSS